MKMIWGVLALVVTLAPRCHAQSLKDVLTGTSRGQTCQLSTLEALSDALQLPGLIVAGDASDGPSSTLVSVACKINPADKTQIYVAMAYDVGDEDTKALILAIIDGRTGQVLADYRGKIYEDATLEVQPDSLRIDTAPYVLAKGVRAFGLDLSGWSSPNCGDGGFGPRRNLYIREGKRIREILDGLYISDWRFIKRGRDRCNSGAPADAPTIIEATTYTLSVLPTVSHGLHDLRVTGVSRLDGGEPDKTAATHRTLEYNGRAYRPKRRQGER